jgi:hypothetical protein
VRALLRPERGAHSVSVSLWPLQMRLQRRWHLHRRLGKQTRLGASSPLESGSIWVPGPSRGVGARSPGRRHALCAGGGLSRGTRMPDGAAPIDRTGGPGADDRRAGAAHRGPVALRARRHGGCVGCLRAPPRTGAGGCRGAQRRRDALLRAWARRRELLVLRPGFRCGPRVRGDSRQSEDGVSRPGALVAVSSGGPPGNAIGSVGGPSGERRPGRLRRSRSRGGWGRRGSGLPVLRGPFPRVPACGRSPEEAEPEVSGVRLARKAPRTVALHGKPHEPDVRRTQVPALLALTGTQRAAGVASERRLCHR